MITMELFDERWCPVVRCDHCRERITDPEMGGIVWGDDQCQATSPAPVLILCKTNHCLGRGPGRHRLWEPLDIFFVNVAHNAGMTTARRWKDARDRSDLRQRL
jgi:hypothetical protein